MPTADLRALAARLGMLKPCEVCLGRGWIARWHDGLNALDSCTCPACVAGHRLPTEAEVRAAIRATGGAWIEIGAGVTFAYVMFGGDISHRATVREDEAAPDELVLLALLRALEVCRGQ